MVASDHELVTQHVLFLMEMRPAELYVDSTPPIPAVRAGLGNLPRALQIAGQEAKLLYYFNLLEAYYEGIYRS